MHPRYKVNTQHQQNFNLVHQVSSLCQKSLCHLTLPEQLYQWLSPPLPREDVNQENKFQCPDFCTHSDILGFSVHFLFFSSPRQTTLDWHATWVALSGRINSYLWARKYVKLGKHQVMGQIMENGGERVVREGWGSCLQKNINHSHFLSKLIIASLSKCNSDLYNDTEERDMIKLVMHATAQLTRVRICILMIIIYR